MIIRLPIEVTVEGRNSLKATTGELESLEKQAKRAGAAAHDVAGGFASGTSRASAFADATGRVSTTLARSVGVLGLNVEGFRALDDAADLAELGMAGLTRAAAGFNAVSVGVAGAGFAIGYAFGSWLNTFPAVQKAADSLFHSMFRFVGLAPRIEASAGPIAEFSKRMGALNDEALKRQVASMRSSGMSDKEIAKFYGSTLTEAKKAQLGISQRQLEVSEKQAKADEKRKQELEAIAKIIGGKKSLTELLSGNWRGLGGLQGGGIATSIADRSSVTTTAQTGSLMGALQGGGIATSLSLSWSQTQRLNQEAAAKAIALADEKTQRLIGTFDTLANQLTNLAQHVGGFGGKLLGIAASLSSGVGGVFSGLAGFKDAGKIGGLTGLLGKIGAAGGILGSAIGAVGGIIGGIKSLFGGKSKEEKAAEAAAKKQAEDDRKAALEEAKRVKIEGLKSAQAAAESLMDRMAKGGMSDKLTGALGTLIGKVQEALLKSGLGYMAAGPLRESAAFMGAQGAAGDVAQLIAGMRAGGAIDAGLLGAAGASADELRSQAVAAAEAAGLAPAEATKAGFGAIAPLLREQLNAALASGQDLDANTKALIEEAKANGISIVADPLVESVAVQRDMLKELQDMNGHGGGRPDASFASGTIGLKQVRRDMLARIHAGEGLMVIPADEMARTSFGSFSKGTDGEDPRERYPRGGGGGGAASEGGGAGEPGAPPTATAGAVQAAILEFRRRPAPVTQVFQPTFKLDPLQTKESREELGRALTDQFLRDLRNNPTVQYAVQRAAKTR